MADFANFGGTDEENAEIKRLNADVVRRVRSEARYRLLTHIAIGNGYRQL